MNVWNRLLLLGALVLVHPLAAQEGARRSDTTVATVLARLPLGSVVRIASGDQLLEGTLRRVTALEVVIGRPDGEAESVHPTAVTGIWRQEGRSTSGGAKRFSIGGGVLGLTVGALAGGAWCEPSHCNVARLSGGALGAVGGAALGALVGAGLGGMMPRWERLFP